MRRLPAICAVVLALSVARAQQGPVTAAPAGSSGSGNCTIEGVVVNAQTGEPVRKAQVSAMREGGPQASNQGPAFAIADVSGRFSLTGLEPGRYHIEVQADRFAPQAYGARRPGGPGKPVELSPGQHLRDLTLRLLPAGVIAGTVRDEDGDPVAGVMVQAMPLGRFRMFQAGNQSQTNDLGAYRIYGLVPGSYIVEVNPPQRSDQGDPSGAYVPTFYPGATAPSAATPIDVQPGSEIHEIDVDIKPVHAAQVRGRLVNPASGRSTQGGWVLLMPRDSDADSPAAAAVRTFSPGRYSAGVQDQHGDFEIHSVPAGSYWAYGTVPDRDRQLQGRVAVEVGETDVQGLIVAVSAGADLTGRVRIEPPKSFNYSILGVGLASLDGMMGGGGGQAKADGSFVLPNIGAGTYRINVGGFPEEYYVKSVKLGGADVLDAGLTVDSVNPGPLDIVLSSQGGTVNGTVVKDHQPTPATVVLVPNPPRRNRSDLYSSKATKADGSFSLLGLPPGDFKLFALEDADANLTSDPSLIQPYEAKGQAVHIEDGRTETVQLELIPADDQP